MLDEILSYKKEEVAKKKLQQTPEYLLDKIRDLPPTQNFQKALEEEPGVSIIAEIKRASPTRGVIRSEFDPVSIARSYEEQGAAAISILTDQKFFKGDLQYLTQVRQVTSLPLLRKDFIIDPYQIYESRLAGADAILLIAGALSQSELAEFCALAGELSLAVLLEVHDQNELDKALLSGNPIIGINNRNLKTFQINLNTTAELLPNIPEDRVTVSESGIREAKDLHWLEELGVDAALVGEALMAEEDIALAFYKLRGKP